MIDVTGIDGRVHSFAEGTSQAQIDAALEAMYGVSPQNNGQLQGSSLGGYSSQGRPSVPVSQVQMLVGGLIGLALLGGLGFMMTREKPAPAFAPAPMPPMAPETPTVLPSDPIPVSPPVTAGPSVVAGAFSGFVATRQGGNAIVRGQAASTGTQIAKLPHGAPVSVTGSVTMPDGLWRQVSIGGATGFIKSELVSQTQPAAIAKAPAPPAAKMIPREFWGFAFTQSDDNVNLRSSPTTSSSIIAAIPTGAYLYVVGEQDGWYLVEWNKKRGWARSTFITREAP